MRVLHEFLHGSMHAAGSWKPLSAQNYNTNLGFLPFAKSLWKSSWKVNGTRLFRSFQWKIFRSNLTCKEFILFSQSECSKQRFMFHFFKAIFDTSFRPSWLFFGKCNRLLQMVNAILGWNIYQSWILLTINLPKQWNDGLPMYYGKQPYM